MLSISHYDQAPGIENINSMYRYLDVLLITLTDNFELIVTQLYQKELQI